MFLVIEVTQGCVFDGCENEDVHLLFGKTGDGWVKRQGWWLCPRHARIDARLPWIMRGRLVGAVVFGLIALFLGMIYVGALTKIGYEIEMLPDWWQLGLLLTYIPAWMASTRIDDRISAASLRKVRRILTANDQERGQGR